MENFFPTREVFAALAPFILQVAPRYEGEIQDFKARHFRLYNIGIQIRRRKCNGDRNDLHCGLRPTIESYCQVSAAIRAPFIPADSHTVAHGCTRQCHSSTV